MRVKSPTLIKPLWLVLVPDHTESMIYGVMCTCYVHKSCTNGPSSPNDFVFKNKNKKKLLGTNSCPIKSSSLITFVGIMDL
jgi:hypothetical protein